MLALCDTREIFVTLEKQERWGKRSCRIMAFQADNCNEVRAQFHEQFRRAETGGRRSDRRALEATLGPFPAGLDGR